MSESPKRVIPSGDPNSCCIRSSERRKGRTKRFLGSSPYQISSYALSGRSLANDYRSGDELFHRTPFVISFGVQWRSFYHIFREQGFMIWVCDRVGIGEEIFGVLFGLLCLTIAVEKRQRKYQAAILRLCSFSFLTEQYRFRFKNKIHCISYLF